TAHCQLFPAEILEPPRHSSRSVKLIVRKYEDDTLKRLLIKRERILLFLEKDTNALALQFGDRIVVSASLKSIQDESNPYSFDPAGYYGRKGVFYQGWVTSTHWKRVGLSERFFVRSWAFSLRDKMLNMLRNNSVKGEEFAVASAILLGYTGEIGQDLRKGFAASGAMHILAVSGMHVGIIFLFLESVLAFLKRRRYGSIVKAILIIVMIWCYAMVTGLSPPVFRAALMISLIIAGRTLKRKPDSLNVVAGSMFVLLLADPSLLLHLGFQFSYLAVFGILVLYKPLLNLIPMSNWILSKLWGLAAVSMAAQIATFPIALYTFHQFPNYFLLTNILVLPLASLVIYSGIGVLAMSPFPLLSMLLAKFLSWIVGWLNAIIRFIEELPGSTFSGIYPALFDVFTLYAGIAVICCFLFFRRAVWIYSLLVLVILWSSADIYARYQRNRCSKIIVFQVKGASQYLLISGRSAICLKDYNASCRSPFAQEILSTCIAAGEISSLQTSYLYESVADSTFTVRLLRIANQRIAIISSVIPDSYQDTLHADILILRNNPTLRMENLVRCFSPHQIVIDPTNSWYSLRKWKEDAETLGVSCYSVMEEGAYIRETRPESSGP
ncbi:MAG: ComEC/Rec2 family competence protein, partial [Bacteroidales bacterium]|nr:ComEC/Rec2 family competence protein [Bacteroidales bacterium]